MKSIYKYYVVVFSFFLWSNVASSSENDIYYRCNWGNSILVDANGVYEGKKWSSTGFKVKDGWAEFDKGDLRLRITANIQKNGVSILRGGEANKGYQFNLDNGKFIYVLLLVPIAKTWTVTGTCNKDTSLIFD